MLALSPATSFTLLLAVAILGTIPGPMIRRGTVQTEFFPEATFSFGVRLLQCRAALSTVTFSFGTFLPTKFSSVPVFSTIYAVSFLAFTLSLSTLSLPILSTSTTATLVLVAAILATSPRTAFGPALALVLPASRGRDFNLILVHDVLDRSLSAMPNAQQRRKIFASATMKPDRVVKSRGRSGMGSNIAWHRRHNDSVH